MDWKSRISPHVDIIAGLLAWFAIGQIVGNRISPEWGGVTLVASVAAGVGAYFAVRHFFPESR